MRSNFEIYPTAVTLYNSNGAIDYHSLKKLINLYHSCNCDGIFAVCQSSEMFFLSDEEKLELAEFFIASCRQLGIKCVVSGHTQDKLSDQIKFLKEMEKLKPDGLILVLNRFASQNEDDNILIERMKTVLNELRPDTVLGMYECPFPYKRLISSQVLDFITNSGRFEFIKDTCCDINMIRKRLDRVKDTKVKIYNANAATMIDSYIYGATGYSGIMMNFIPEHLMILKENLSSVYDETGNTNLSKLQISRAIGDFIIMTSTIEYQNYPENAKYMLMHKGIVRNTVTRKEFKPLTLSQRLELKSYINISTKELSKVSMLDGRKLIFNSGEHFENCHASTVLPLDNDIVIVAYFAGSREGAHDTGIWFSRKVKDNWNEPVCIAKTNDTAYWNPVLFKIENGIRIVFKKGNDITTWRSYTMVSYDAGATWSPEEIYDALELGSGPVRTKPLRMRDGTLLATNSRETVDSWRPFIDRSDDDGKSFHRYATIPVNIDYPDMPNYIEGKGAIQPTIWESKPDNLHVLLRTTCGYIFRSDSIDAGKTWCEAYNTYIANNNSGIDTAYINGTLYLICNPISGNWSSRNPLAIYKSDDNGESFILYRALESEEYDLKACKCAEFSYPSAVIGKNILYLSYTYKRTQIAYFEIELNNHGFTC